MERFGQRLGKAQTSQTVPDSAAHPRQNKASNEMLRRNAVGGRLGSAKEGKRGNEAKRGSVGAPVADGTYSPDELAEYEAVFSIFDADGNGSIGVDELGRAMASLGLSSERGELESLIREVDEDGNGEIDFEEFCTCMKRLSVKKATWEDVIGQCFQAFDCSEQGHIQESDFRFILRSLGGFDDDDLIDEIFREIDVDRNGVIDRTEFAAMVRNYLTDEDIQ